jgi:hypothetical protein
MSGPIKGNSLAIDGAPKRTDRSSNQIMKSKGGVNARKI